MNPTPVESLAAAAPAASRWNTSQAARTSRPRIHERGPQSGLHAGYRLCTDSLFRKGMLTVLDQAIVSAANLATAILIGRLCSQEDLGVYSLALSIVVFARGVQENVVSAPYLVYCHRRSGDERATYAGSSFAHHLALTALAVSALLLFALVSSRYGPAGLLPVLWVLLGATPFLLLREYIRHLAFAHLQLSVAIAIDLVACGLQIGGLLLLGVAGRLSVPAAYGVMGLASAASAAAWLLWRPQPMRFERRRIAEDWRRNWSFARWALVTMLLGSAAPYLMPWILAGTEGVAETGAFYACQTLVAVANMFALGYCRFLGPRAARAMTEGGVAELRGVLAKSALLFAAVIGAFCVVALAAGGPIVHAIYGTRYADAGPTIGVLALASLAGSMGIVVGNGLWAMERPAANFAADVCSFLVTLATAIALTASCGALGAALATLAGIGVGTGVRAWTLRRLMQTQISEARAA